MNKLEKRLEEKRILLGLSKVNFAGKIGISYNSYTKLLKNPKSVSVNVLNSVSGFLGVSNLELIEEAKK